MKTRMFRSVEKTWNPVVGCSHNCIYCWARRQAKRQKHRCQFCYKFIPHLHLERKVPKANLIFVCSMGDLFCDVIHNEWIEQVIGIVRQHKDRDFLFCTKNPKRYLEFDFPRNCLLGTTIETNKDELVEKVSQAPLPSERYKAMLDLDGSYRKFLSVEPIMEFDFDVFLGWIKDINPNLCEIGYDNYGFNLIEPEVNKTLKLIEEKRKLGIDTRIKELKKQKYCLESCENLKRFRND